MPSRVHRGRPRRATSPPAAPAATARQHEQAAAALRAKIEALGAQFVAPRGHPCWALAWRLRHFQGKLLTCVTQPAVPPDNHTAERAIRPQVFARTISSGTRSAHGSETRRRLASLAVTWSASGFDLLAQFRQFLQSA